MAQRGGTLAILIMHKAIIKTFKWDETTAKMKFFADKNICDNNFRGRK
jgi:hypothetical protein